MKKIASFAKDLGAPQPLGHILWLQVCFQSRKWIVADSIGNTGVHNVMPGQSGRASLSVCQGRSVCPAYPTKITKWPLGGRPFTSHTKLRHVLDPATEQSPSNQATEHAVISWGGPTSVASKGSCPHHWWGRTRRKVTLGAEVARDRTQKLKISIVSAFAILTEYESFLVLPSLDTEI